VSTKNMARKVFFFGDFDNFIEGFTLKPFGDSHRTFKPSEDTFVGFKGHAVVFEGDAKLLAGFEVSFFDQGGGEGELVFAGNGGGVIHGKEMV
jgi:hypothetical protein